MRSFIKLHRKYEANASELSDLEIDTVPAINSKNHFTTPTSSPILPQNLQFTPPQISNSTLSSPKKLLTPIRNLFSSSNSNIKGSINPPASGDNLNSIINGKSKVKVRKRDEAIEQETEYPVVIGKNNHNIPTRIPNTSNDNFYKISEGKFFRDGKYVSGKELPISEINQPKNETESTEDPYSCGKNITLSNSTVSLGSENKFIRKVSFKSPEKTKHKNDAKSLVNEYSSNDEFYESDSSSQFSFVRDKCGGRNTSVKYYKTQKLPDKDKDNMYIEQYNVNDLGFGDSDLSDYDFENNGYEEYSDENPENEQGAQYNKLFDDDKFNCDLDCERENSNPFHESTNTSSLYHDLHHERQTSNSNISLMSKIKPEIKKIKIFNKSFHLSIDGIDRIAENIQESNHMYDILENYLEIKESSAPYETETTSRSRETYEYSSSENLQLFDLSSPLINGLTIGNNLRHRSSGIRNVKPNNENTRRNNLFIHRHINMDESILSDSISPKLENFKERTLLSFHSSISDDLVFRTQEKVKQFDRFSENHSLDVNKTSKYNHGLGIFKDSIKSSKSINNNTIPEDIDFVDGLDETEILESTEVKSNFVENRQPGIVELTKEDDKDSESSKKKNRKSIDNMMSALASLESNATTANKRASVDNMMNTLKLLEIPEISVADIKHESKLKEPNKSIKKSHTNLIHTIPQTTNRYSWINNDEYTSFSTSRNELNKTTLLQQSTYDSEESDYERPGPALSQELIDEINTLPEDFDFEEHERKQYEVSTTPREVSYHRSNSYLKKPVKAVIENKYSSTKIETTNKTVTFYRSNSFSSDYDRSRSISRATSVLSNDSTNELIEEEESEESDECDIPLGNRASTNDRELSNFHKSFESLGRHSSNLVTISETNMPGVLPK